MAATATPLIYDFLRHHFGTVKDVVLREKTLASWPVLAAGALVTFLILDQVVYAYKKWRYGYAGPAFTVPFLGGIAEMVSDPYGFWEKQRQYAPSGVSCNQIFGNFMTFVTEPQAIKKVLTDNGPSGFLMVLHPSGKRILGENNIAFLHGPGHKALRNSFLPLFTRKALSTYLNIQEGLIRAHIDTWLRSATGTPLEARDIMRTLNQQTSQSVFVGPYLEDPASFGKWYLQMTDGFLSLPVYFPGTALWNAVRAREKVVATLSKAAKQSKALMADASAKGLDAIETGTAKCLLDFWSVRINELIAEAGREGRPADHFTSDWAMGDSMMDFLFASQDASTASLTWCVHYLSENPDVLVRVREEQHRLRPNDEPLTYELLEQMSFARMVVKEILRIRTPAPMVPNIAMADIKLTETVSVPKGTLVLPSIWNASQQGFPAPEKFDPDRMDPAGRREDMIYRDNYLPFGCGPHMCVGREYAMNHLMAFLALFATSVDWTRTKDGGEQEILYLPTLYPKTCKITMQPRPAYGAPTATA